MDAFQQFTNLAGFFVGNEVLTTLAGSPAAPYVKAAARDLKAYRDAKGYRNIPVGYSAADIASLRPMLQEYLACGDDPKAALDFFALNAYEWCGNVDYKTSGYEALTANVTKYHIPIFFSETGCNTIQPRTHEDQGAIFGPEMSKYWSGSIIYEWIQEMNHYGLISYGPQVDPSSPGAPPDGFPRSGTPVPVQPDFDNLKKQWAAVNPTGVAEAAYTPTLPIIPCPERTPGTWEVDPKAPLPTVPGSKAVTTASPTGNSTKTSSATSHSHYDPATITSSMSLATKTTVGAVITTTSMAGRYPLAMTVMMMSMWVVFCTVMPF